MLDMIFNVKRAIGRIKERRMNRTSLGLIAGVMALLLVSSSAFSQAAGPTGMKLYAFSSGALTLPKSALQSGAPSTPIMIPVGFFVITHPKGNLLFDTGNNDKIINDPSYWGPFIKHMNPERGPDVAIDTQLKKIGLSPDDIKYVAIGHMHLDHGGNVCKFPKAIVLVQKEEMKSAAWPEPGTAGYFGATSASRSPTSSRCISSPATWMSSVMAASSSRTGRATPRGARWRSCASRRPAPSS